MQRILKQLDNGKLIFGQKEINVIIDKKNEFWFHAKQIGDALGYYDPKEAIRTNVDKEDMVSIKNIKLKNKKDKIGHPDTYYINN